MIRSARLVRHVYGCARWMLFVDSQSVHLNREDDDGPKRNKRNGWILFRFKKSNNKGTVYIGRFFCFASSTSPCPDYI